jgi:NADH:ubiquinone oxidoreductase subunit 4 (subunit M)
LIRFIDPLFPEYTSRYREIFIIASIVSMSFAVISIMFQEDLKRIFSYFSIIHMNLYFMIFLSDVNRNQFIFSTLQHGLTAILMFFTSDVIENLFKTRSISIIKNSTTQSHKSKILLLFVSLALIGAPYTSGFIAETISFYSIIKLKGIIIPIITLSIIAALSAYTLFTYHSMFCKKKNLSQIAIQTDGLCDNYQMTSLVISYFCILLLGIFPALLL